MKSKLDVILAVIILVMLKKNTLVNEIHPARAFVSLYFYKNNAVIT